MGLLSMLVVLAWVGPGCNQMQGRAKEGPVTRLTPKSVPYLQGVPVPSGFKIAERLTDAYESGDVRFARQEYVGNAERHSVREFYREQMPVLGWKEISAHEVKGRISMRFENDDEECTLTIEPSGWFNRTTIQVVIKPFTRNPTEPPNRRPMP